MLKELNIKFLWTLILALFIGLASCCGSTNEIKLNDISNVEIKFLIAERIIPVSGNNIVSIPDSVNCSIYRFKFVNDSVVNIDYGFGNVSKKKIVLRILNKKSKVILPYQEKKDIYSLLNTIREDSSYISNSDPTDSWLIQINDGTKESLFWNTEMSDFEKTEYARLIKSLIRILPGELPRFDWNER